MNYIGSKFSLLDFLTSSIDEVVDGKANVFCDLFAGTGAVGVAYKRKGYRILANDIQYYSYVLNRHYIGNNQNPKFQALTKIISGLTDWPLSERASIVCHYLNELPGLEGFIYKNYCLGGTKGSDVIRQYFSDENGLRCDAIRLTLEQWRAVKLINEDEYFFLLACLIEAIDKYANTASVYGAFLKHLKKSAAKKLVIKPIDIVEGKNKNEVYNQNGDELITKLKGDILYLDPPYNHRQYATNYHLLETIAKYDSPEIHGKTGLREYSEQKSKWAMRSQVKYAFEAVIRSANMRYIFLSYNNEGLMTPEEIKEIMSTRGEYGFFTKEYNRFRADRDENRSYKASKTVEYLHYVICK